MCIFHIDRLRRLTTVNSLVRLAVKEHCLDLYPVFLLKYQLQFLQMVYCLSPIFCFIHLFHTSVSSSLSKALLQPSQLMKPSRSSAERAFHDLEVYKTPIVPSRYKDAGAIPVFLRPKRAHVPVPLTNKGKESKPGLGMPEKSKAGRKKDGRSTRDHGKPYARSSNIGKLLARRRAEDNEEGQGVKPGLDSVAEEDEMDTDQEVSGRKRDVAVSARMTSGSEDDRPSKAAAAPVKVVDVDVVPVASRNDPFLRQPTAVAGGRQQPYGRVGRTRMRDPGQRSVPLGRPTNRFAATFDDDDDAPGGDEQSMNLDEVESNDQKAPVMEESAKTPVFEAPKGFSFASNVCLKFKVWIYYSHNIFYRHRTSNMIIQLLRSHLFLLYHFHLPPSLLLLFRQSAHLRSHLRLNLLYRHSP